MKRLIEFATLDDGSIVVEVEQSDADGLVKAARPGEIIIKATQTFDEAMEKVRPAASTIIRKLRSLQDPPDEINVEFGLKLTAEAGAIVAAAGVEANYTITLKWKRAEEPKKVEGKTP